MIPSQFKCARTEQQQNASKALTGYCCDITAIYICRVEHKSRGVRVYLIIAYLGLHLCLSLFRDERLPNTKGNARLIHGLVRGYGHMDLVSHAKEK